MTNIAFCNHNYLVQREVISALQKISTVRLIIINTIDYPSLDGAQKTADILIKQACNVLITINDWGMDFDGFLADFLHRHQIIHINWCVDDPFFLEIFHKAKTLLTPNRIDFVSDRGYLDAMRKRGHNVHFLPLATDPAIFSASRSPLAYRHSIGFVGSSYRQQIDEFLETTDDLLLDHSGQLAEILAGYRHQTGYDIDAAVETYASAWKLPETLPQNKAVFIAKSFVSYLYRKELVVMLCKKYPSFKIWGDPFWLVDLPEDRVDLTVKYYTNLNQTYQQTKINIDINRLVIRDGFTQRVFDCLASGSFIITNSKPLIKNFFDIESSTPELIVFYDSDDLCRKIDYFLNHTAERRAIAERGRKKVLAEHTYDHRVREMLGVVFQSTGCEK